MASLGWAFSFSRGGTAIEREWRKWEGLKVGRWRAMPDRSEREVDCYF
jgi:hypothetical protein